jgi:hypothetical protein
MREYTMSDFKSKLPDFKEISSMTSKLFKGIKDSVTEIIHDYKQKRAEAEVKAESADEMDKATTKPAESSKAKPAASPPVTPIETPAPVGKNEDVAKGPDENK